MKRAWGGRNSIEFVQFIRYTVKARRCSSIVESHCQFGIVLNRLSHSNFPDSRVRFPAWCYKADMSDAREIEDYEEESVTGTIICPSNGYLQLVGQCASKSERRITFVICLSRGQIRAAVIRQEILSVNGIMRAIIPLACILCYVPI